MSIKLFQVDAFTDEPFAGNPAAICILPSPKDASWMQQVAQEMNLSETAFVCKQDDSFSLRWFTPTTEVDLCGHATLACAHILWKTGLLKANEPAQFHTLCGTLMAEQRGGLIELSFPLLSEEPASAPPELITILGVTPKYVGKFGAKYLVEVDTEEAVRKLNPNFHLLRQLSERGVVVTSAASSPKYDFVSRYFAPWIGIDEDSVTGSVHFCLGPFWGKRFGKDRLRAFQASARGGVIHIRLEGGQVYLGGRAITVFEGELYV